MTNERTRLTHFVLSIASATIIAFVGLRADTSLNRSVALWGAAFLVVLAAWRLWRPRNRQQTRAIR
jgi:hypothetical protein